MKPELLLCFLLLGSTCLLTSVSGAKILALVTVATHSHHIWNRALMLALAARGHQVTVVSPDAEKTRVTNHTDILLENCYVYSHEEYDYEAFSVNTAIDMMYLMFDWGLNLCDQQLSTEGGKKLLAYPDDTRFDLIIVEPICAECFLGFVHKFGSPPVMGVSALGIPLWYQETFGNPEIPSYVPNFYVSFTDRMTFLERVYNAGLVLYTTLYRNLVYLPRMEEIARKHFGPGLPPLKDIERNISLVLTNTSPGLDYPRPLQPTVIPVGGMHLKPAKTLPQDLKKYLDDAKEGAIFFSLGSNMRSDLMTVDRRQAITEALAELPQRILWKWESDELPGKPDNVKLGKWLPQNDILGHPNVKLFITHCGLLSSQEAIYHGVPIVGMPFFLDQHNNLKKLVALGVGEGVQYGSLSKQMILDAVNKVIKNPSYRENMKRLSAVLEDQPETPLQRAIFWTEYVIKHGGARHLRSGAMDLTWYQYLLLDVLAFVAAILFLLLGLAYLSIKLACRAFRGRKASQDKKQD